MAMHSTTRPNKQERDRLDRLSKMRCVCCTKNLESGRERVTGSVGRVEVHHIVDKGYRSHSGGHSSTIPLCVWHHRGVHFTHYNADQMAIIYGPSLARTKKRFVNEYGDERALLDVVNEELAK